MCKERINVEINVEIDDGASLRVRNNKVAKSMRIHSEAGYEGMRKKEQNN